MQSILDEKVWVFTKYGWEVGRRAGNQVILEDDQGRTETMEITKNFKMIPFLDSHLNIADDLVDLEDLDEPVLMFNLQDRYMHDEIYTRIGQIIISINPFKNVDLYESQMDHYDQATDPSSLPPHIYLASKAALENLRNLMQSQSILISGESGAGKTEATKILLQYLTALTANEDTRDLADSILAANPILEAFGNAKTVRNDNSSRFGKLIKVHFDFANVISGAKLFHYLLESSRVISQAPEERNFHIFYQLIKGTTREEKKKYNLLSSVNDYQFLSNGDITIPGYDDAKQWRSLNSSFDKLGFETETKEKYFTILSAILHLGNINFIGDEQVQVDNLDRLKLISEMLEIDKTELKNALEQRLLMTNRNTAYSIPLNQAQAIENRNALAKSLYTSMFAQLFDKINECLTRDMGAQDLFIAILDIYGFENFETNSLEQFCINYANEKLHGNFVETVLLAEQEDYVKEEIAWTPVDVSDNKGCLQVIEGTNGVVALLNEECSLPKGSEENLFLKLSYAMKDREEKKFLKVNQRFPGFFEVHHYAGTVKYSLAGILTKNNNILQGDLIKAMMMSKSSIINAMFYPFLLEDKNERGKGPRSARETVKGGIKKESKQTICTIFKQQLWDLFSQLENTQRHYIRCINPNSEKAPNFFDYLKVLGQIQSNGIHETVRIRKLGYQYRMALSTFNTRYDSLYQTPDRTMKDLKILLQSHLAEANRMRVSHRGNHQELFVCGKSKVFMRGQLYTALEMQRKSKLERFVEVMQRFIRQYNAWVDLNYLQEQRVLRLKKELMEREERKKRLAAEKAKMEAEIQSKRQQAKEQIQGRKVHKKSEKRHNAVAKDAEKEKERERERDFKEKTLKILDTLRTKDKDELARLQAKQQQELDQLNQKHQQELDDLLNDQQKRMSEMVEKLNDLRPNEVPEIKVPQATNANAISPSHNSQGANSATASDSIAGGTSHSNSSSEISTSAAKKAEKEERKEREKQEKAEQREREKAERHERDKAEKREERERTERFERERERAEKAESLKVPSEEGLVSSTGRERGGTDGGGGEKGEKNGHKRGKDTHSASTEREGDEETDSLNTSGNVGIKMPKLPSQPGGQSHSPTSVTPDALMSPRRPDTRPDEKTISSSAGDDKKDSFTAHTSKPLPKIASTPTGLNFKQKGPSLKIEPKFKRKEDKHKPEGFVFEYVDRDFKEILKETNPDITFFQTPDTPEEVPYDRIKPTVQQCQQSNDQDTLRSFLYNLLPTQFNEFLCDLCSAPGDRDVVLLQAVLPHIYGWHLNERNAKQVCTPLHCAAQSGSHLAVLAILNSKYFDSLNKVDGRGSTALHLASNNGHATCVALLLCKGALTNIQNKMAATAKLEAKNEQIKELFALHEQKKVAQIKALCPIVNELNIEVVLSSLITVTFPNGEKKTLSSQNDNTLASMLKAQCDRRDINMNEHDVIDENKAVLSMDLKIRDLSSKKLLIVKKNPANQAQRSETPPEATSSNGSRSATDSPVSGRYDKTGTSTNPPQSAKITGSTPTIPRPEDSPAKANTAKLNRSLSDKRSPQAKEVNSTRKDSPFVTTPPERAVSNKEDKDPYQVPMAINVQLPALPSQPSNANGGRSSPVVSGRNDHKEQPPIPQPKTNSTKNVSTDLRASSGRNNRIVTTRAAEASHDDSSKSTASQPDQSPGLQTNARDETEETCACKKCTKQLKLSAAIKINDYLFCDTCHKELLEMSKQKTMMLQQKEKDAEKAKGPGVGKVSCRKCQSVIEPAENLKISGSYFCQPCYDMLVAEIKKRKGLS